MREFELLQTVYQANQALPARVVLPPGDDMGAVRVQSDLMLLTVDQVADGVHVDLRSMPLEKVGRKAITRNLSDVAAMAAAPVAAVAAASLPRDFGHARAQALFEAMRSVAAAWDCPLIGGDVSMWDHPLLISVTVLAQPVPGIAPVRRSGAKAGDRIYVTGRLGGSIECVDGYTHHLDFEPRVALAQQLARQVAIGCMIDLSDGLARDLGHLCVAGTVAAEIWPEALPTSAGAIQAAARSGRPAWQHALGDGEDYELCFCAGADQQVPKELGSVPITCVGQMLPPRGEGGTIELKWSDGRRESLGDLGWEHRGQ